MREIQRGRDLHEEAVDQVLRDVYRKKQMEEQDRNVQGLLGIGNRSGGGNSMEYGGGAQAQSGQAW